MMSPDIRDHYNIQDPYEAKIAFKILTVHPPQLCTGTTGIDSLTTVLRRVYAHAMIGPDGIAQTQWVKDAEQENPILSYAWTLMGNTEEAAAAAQLVRARTIQSMGGIAGTDDPSFKELCTSEMMNKTFWSQRHFCLYYPVYSWRTYSILEQSPSVKATESIVIMDRIESPEISLQEAVESKFGDFDIQEGNCHYRPSQPLVVRVLLRTNGDVNNDPENRLRFKDLQRFQIPQEDPKKVDKGWILVEGKRLNYTIAAVVKMREVEAKNHPDVNQNEVETEDKVRTYGPSRNEIIPAYEDQHLMSTRWSVEDQRPYPMEYMLFYMPFKPERKEKLEGPGETGRAPEFNVKAWQGVQDLFTFARKRRNATHAENESQHGRPGSQGQSQAEPAQSSAAETPATTEAPPEASKRRGRQQEPMPPQEQAFKSRQGGRGGSRRKK